MQHHYDVIVIGAGVGGLAAAGLLARAGYSVLVLERHAVVGGCCSTFRRAHFIFDAAVHAIGGCSSDDIIGQWLNDMEVAQEIEFVRLDPFYTINIAGEKLEIPANLHELKHALLTLSPNDASAIQQVIDEIEMFGSYLLDQNNPKQNAYVLEQTARRSWSEFLAGRFTAIQPEVVLNSLCLYAGVEPDRVSAAFMLGVIYSYHRGAYYPIGSTQHFVNTLARAIRLWGGEIKRKATVAKVLINEQGAYGVRLANGDELTARVIISNADACKTLLEWIGSVHLPTAYIRRLQRAERSASAITMYLGVREGQWEIPAHETFYFPGWKKISMRDLYYHPAQQAVSPVLSICVPTHSDPGLAPAQHQILAITTLAQAEVVEGIRDQHGKTFIEQDFLKHIEQHLPGVISCIRFQEMATPRTVERYTNNGAGAIYGWEKTTEHWEGGIRQKTPIPHLYLAGHWTQGVHGVYGAFRSGITVAQMIVKTEKAYLARS